jgi:5-(carboxyamino)imidazole ribonucleotide mutase
MPKGVPVATVAIGASGSANAGLLSAQILALNDSELQKALSKKREEIAEIIEIESSLND